jgi:hypothetical protein
MVPSAALLVAAFAALSAFPASGAAPESSHPQTVPPHALPSVPPPVPRPVRKVLIIGIDGLRADAFRRADTPNLDRLKRDGALSEHTVTDVIARSGPGWTSVLTGVWSWKHGVRENTFSGYRRDLHPTFFDRIAAARPAAVLGAVVNWKPLGEHLFGGRGFWIAPGDDRAVAEEAARLIGTGLPDILFVHLDGVDQAGHTFGFSPDMPFYLWAVEKADGWVGRLADAARARTGEQWLILVTSDHGGSYRHHGANTREERTVFLLANGPGCRRERPAGFRGVVDVAPTVFAYLGLPVSESWKWDGRPIGYAPAPGRDPACLLGAVGALDAAGRGPGRGGRGALTGEQWQ